MEIVKSKPRLRGNELWYLGKCVGRFGKYPERLSDSDWVFFTFRNWSSHHHKNPSLDGGGSLDISKDITDALEDDDEIAKFDCHWVVILYTHGDGAKTVLGPYSIWDVLEWRQYHHDEWGTQYCVRFEPGTR